MIKAKTIGNIMVQQYVTNWSKRILGNEALTQMNKNTIKDVLQAIIKEKNKFALIGSSRKRSTSMLRSAPIQ